MTRNPANSNSFSFPFRVRVTGVLLYCTESFSILPVYIAEPTSNGCRYSLKPSDYKTQLDFKDPVLSIEHCTLPSLGGQFCDVENSEAFVCGQNRTL